MNKDDLVKEVALKVEGLSQKDVLACINATLLTIKEAGARGEKVQLIGFGTFEARKRAERIGRNPQTKENITIPETIVPYFKAGTEYKNMVKPKPPAKGKKK